MIREMRREHGGGPIPMTRAQIAELRAAQANVSPARHRQLGWLDLDRDVVEVDGVPESESLQ